MNALPVFPFREGPVLVPPAEYASLHAPAQLTRVMLRDGQQASLASRYEDVRKVLSDDRFSRARHTSGPLFAREPQSLALVTSDAPDHTRRRRAVTAAFTAHRAEQARPAIKALAHELITGMRGAGPVADLVDMFAVPFPLIVMCDLLGIPAADRFRFRGHVSAMMSTSRYPAAEVTAAHGEMRAYFTRMVDSLWSENCSYAREGLVAALGRPAPFGHQLSREEAAVMAAGLLIAGSETTSNQLAICVYLLLSERRRWKYLRAHPDAVPGAIEEMLRWTPFFATGGPAHVATEDVQLRDGTIHAGEVVVPLIDAANRDPEVFGHPADLRLEREANPHLAFGHGRHYCLGAHLARVELQSAISCLLREVPDLALAAAEPELPWRQGMFIRGVWHLPVHVTEVRSSDR